MSLHFYWAIEFSRVRKDNFTGSFVFLTFYGKFTVSFGFVPASFDSPVPCWHSALLPTPIALKRPSTCFEFVAASFDSPVPSWHSALLPTPIALKRSSTCFEFVAASFDSPVPCWHSALLPTSIALKRSSTCFEFIPVPVNFTLTVLMFYSI